VSLAVPPGPRALALAGLVALTAGALAAIVLGDVAMASFLPALILPAVLLTLKRYPGEGVLVVLARARRASRPRPRSSAQPPARETHLLPRGGMLIARSLAVRPPPRIAAAG